MVAARLQTDPSFRVVSEEPLFELIDTQTPMTNYDVGLDGRFLMIVDEVAGRQSINLVLNWFEELKRLVSGGE